MNTPTISNSEPVSLPDRPPVSSQSASTAPAADSTERTLAGIFATVLGRENVGPRDSFFTLGGNSLKLARMVALARRAGLRLDFDLAFHRPTVAGLAEAIARGEGAHAGDEFVREVVLGEQASSRRIHVILTSGKDLYLVSALGEHPAMRGTAVHVLMPQWNAAKPYIPAEEQREEFVRRLAREPTAEGYRIVGHCSAGPIAARVAAELQRLGHRVDKLVLLDAEVPGPGQRLLPLDTLMPDLTPVPAWLVTLREDMARTSELRVSGVVTAAEAMRRMWSAVSVCTVELLTAILGTDAGQLSDADLDQAIRNFMAWLHLVVGLEEPLTSRLDEETVVALFVSEDAFTAQDVERWRRQWLDTIGGSVRAYHQPGEHHALLHNAAMLSLLGAGADRG